MFKFTSEIISKAFSHNQFMELTNSILENELKEKPYDNQSYFDYTSVNYNRISKILRNFQLDKKLYNELSCGINNWTWILLNEPWCGDGSFIQPVLYAMSIASAENINFKVLLRDKNAEIMKHFLTNGGMAIPKLICLDSELNIIGTWGPRPEALSNKFYEWKKEKLLVDIKNKIKLVNRWYLKDKNKSIQKEFLLLVKKWKKEQYVK